MKKISTLVGIIIIVIAIVIIFGGVFAYKYFGSQKIKNKPISQTSNWAVALDLQHGFQFQYPQAFDTNFAQLQNLPVSAIVTASGGANIDSKGCYILSNDENFKESQATENNIKFCLSAGSGVGAGQLYNDYYYTTYKDGNYITLPFTVHTSNGCDAYMGISNYQPCLDFFKNYNDIVLKQIQKSVSTLQFIPAETKCNIDKDCQNGASCITQGPPKGPNHQILNKVCIPKGGIMVP